MNAITFECKKGYSRATLHDLLDRPGSAKNQPYAEWVEQARNSAVAAGTPYWVVIHRRDRRETLIAVPYRLLRAMELVPADFTPFADVGVTVKHGGKLERVRLAVTTLAAFLERVTPDMIRALAENHVQEIPKTKGK